METTLKIRIAENEEKAFGLNFKEARERDEEDSPACSYPFFYDEISIFLSNSITGFEVYSAGFDGSHWQVEGRFSHLSGFDFVEELNRVLL